MLLPEKYNFSLNRNIAHFQFEGNNIKKVGTGQQKDGKEGGTKKKQLEKHFAVNWVNWQQVGNMTGHRNSILERQNVLGENMSRG